MRGRSFQGFIGSNAPPRSATATQGAQVGRRAVRALSCLEADHVGAFFGAAECRIDRVGKERQDDLLPAEDVGVRGCAARVHADAGMENEGWCAPRNGRQRG